VANVTINSISGTFVVSYEDIIICQVNKPGDKTEIIIN
jgi:hypothetical protein